MLRSTLTLISSLHLSLCTVAQFAPPAGQAGSTAIYKDSSIFIAWATGCTINRGPQDISNTPLGPASAGDSSMALGKAGTNATVSLGDGGYAIVTFDTPIANGPGPDFAVFENAFSDTFLELAYVEVSSDGTSFFRFPATSNTQDTAQVGSFGTIDATKINNLAGKYRALYGTPFDLQELSGISGLNINNITHIKIIDVIGCIQNTYARYDKNNRKINDPWNTPFASGGFDLDAIGIINSITSIVNVKSEISEVSIFPNPVGTTGTIRYYLEKSKTVNINLNDISGKIIKAITNETQLQGWQNVNFETNALCNGFYFLNISTGENNETIKVVITNEK